MKEKPKAEKFEEISLAGDTIPKSLKRRSVTNY